MRQKRERLQVIHDILKAVSEKQGRIKPTHVMYKANLSHQMLNEYLGYLLSEGFIEEKQSRKGKTYSLTQKGLDYLNKYDVIRGFMDSFGMG